MIPDDALERIRQWAEHKIPEDVRDQVRLELDVTDRTITIQECRPPWHPDMGDQWTRFPVARLRYTKARDQWSLYWRDRSLKFHEYDLAEPSSNVRDLLDEVDRDPTAIFWG